MTDDMAAIRASDELINALSQRRDLPDHDVVVDTLASLVEYVDAAPGPTIERSPAPAAQRRPRTHRRLGVAIGVALAVSSSGIAAAVTGDPLTPVNFVAKTVYDFAQRHTTGSDQQVGAGSRDRHLVGGPSQSGAHPLEQQSAADLFLPVDDRPEGSQLENPGVSTTASGATDPLSSVVGVDPADVLAEGAGDSEATDDADTDQVIPDTTEEADPVIDPAPGTEDVPPDTCIPPIPEDGTTQDGPASCEGPSDPAPEPQPEPEPEPQPEPQPEPETQPETEPDTETNPEEPTEPDRIPEEEPAPSDGSTTP